MSRLDSGPESTAQLWAHKLCGWRTAELYFSSDARRYFHVAWDETAEVRGWDQEDRDEACVRRVLPNLPDGYILNLAATFRE